MQVLQVHSRIEPRELHTQNLHERRYCRPETQLQEFFYQTIFLDLRHTKHSLNNHNNCVDAGEAINLPEPNSTILPTGSNLLGGYRF